MDKFWCTGLSAILVKLVDLLKSIVRLERNAFDSSFSFGVAGCLTILLLFHSVSLDH